ncbi:hypothetical protein O181_048239 [Austropuccinia psidii MF-1]|uniref:Uncharacterized protein n=1 Tax=Austropuccinia psidii MF-1 TaxID=1389203 RepID=A0A9Q3HMS6_9BASI|nr:hypothetical protein [Austropuccinia psidii MF-1]
MKMKDKGQTWKDFLKKDTFGGCQSFPHSPRSVLTTFEINSESKLIQGNVLRAELLPSGSHVQIYVPVQKLVQSSQGRGMGNFSKPLAGGNELLLINQELSGSGKDHGTIKRMESLFLQRQSQKDKELVEEQNSFIHRPTEGTGNDPSFGERRTSSFNKLQTSFRTVQTQAQRTSEEKWMSQDK